VAEVRGDSELRSEYSAHERRVRLLRGEAHFTVVKDAARPFVVSAGDTAVRAIGTAFNVRLDRGRIEVLVTEGKVQVADAGPSGLVEPEAPMVSAGHRAVVESSGPGGVAAARAKVEITAAAPAEMDQALAWQTTRLVFDRTPLAEAVDAFNRHAAPTGMRLAIGDSKLRARRMGGSFRAANMEAFVRLLEQSVEVRAERRGDLVVLLPVE
jgi:transmembrane sensor